MEGKYDKIKLSGIIDALILPVGGFQIYKDRELRKLLQTLAADCGLIIMTDSDAAGFQIRNYIGGLLPKSQVTHVYIPDIFGREKRKAAASKEGKLGVEGVDRDVIEQSLRRAGVAFEAKMPEGRQLTVADLFEDGLSGRAESKALRLKLLQKLNLPQRLSTHALLDLINKTVGLEKYREILKELNQEKKIKELSQ